ncbi:MAG TPA: hypothetical protein VH593_08365, partial [Ktedonobacteraceae bacterium]
MAAMNHMSSEKAIHARKKWLIAALECLLELPTTNIASMLNQAAQLITEALAIEKIDIFLYDATTEMLVALPAEITSLEELQHAIGKRLPLVNGGHIVDVFLTGIPYLARRIDL